MSAVLFVLACGPTAWGEALTRRAAARSCGKRPGSSLHLCEAFHTDQLASPGLPSLPADFQEGWLVEAVSTGLALQGLGVSREKLLLRGSPGVL